MGMSPFEIAILVIAAALGVPVMLATFRLEKTGGMRVALALVYVATGTAFCWTSDDLLLRVPFGCMAATGIGYVIHSAVRGACQDEIKTTILIRLPKKAARGQHDFQSPNSKNPTTRVWCFCEHDFILDWFRPDSSFNFLWRKKIGRTDTQAQDGLQDRAGP